MAWYEKVGTPYIGWYNEDWGVGYIFPRKVGNDWEYWFTDWRYHVDSVAFVLRGGKKYDENNNEIKD